MSIRIDRVKLIAEMARQDMRVKERVSLHNYRHSWRKAVQGKYCGGDLHGVGREP